MGSRASPRLIEEKATHVFVAAYRGFALVVATFQIFFLGYFQLYSTFTWTLFAIACAYTLYKVSRPLRPYRRALFTYGDFSFDLALCICLPILTGGLNSPFLLYCLCPVLTSALFFPKKITFIIAGIPALALATGQLAVYPASFLVAFYPLQLSLALLAAVIVASFLIAWLPYMININASQIIRSQAILSERNRLSREIHDGVAQSLGIARWKVEALQEAIAGGKMSQALSQVTEVKNLVEKAQGEVRETVSELRLDTESKQGFVPALARYTTEFTQNYGIHCELYVADGQVNLPAHAKTELLRIASETLSNVGRHSAASRVEVTFESKKDYLEMTIRDNGRGFNPQASLSGHGLAVMEERAVSLGGELVITTGPGQGTEVKARLPVPRAWRDDHADRSEE